LRLMSGGNKEASDFLRHRRVEFRPCKLSQLHSWPALKFLLPASSSAWLCESSIIEFL
jgi:hypothetical protein